MADTFPANNPDLKADAVPRGSAAQKTDSALGHYAAGLAADQKNAPDEATKISKTYGGDSVPMTQEPALAERIESDAEKARNPVVADHFAEAANQLRAAHDQDKQWLEKHPQYDQNSRS